MIQPGKEVLIHATTWMKLEILKTLQEVKEASHKSCVWYNSIDRKCPELANPWKQKVDYCCQGLKGLGDRE